MKTKYKKLRRDNKNYNKLKNEVIETERLFLKNNKDNIKRLTKMIALTDDKDKTYFLTTMLNISKNAIKHYTSDVSMGDYI